MKNKAICLFLLFGVFIFSLFGLVIGAMANHSGELDAYLEDYAEANRYRNINIADRNNVPIYTGSFSDNDTVRLSTFHIVGDRNGSLPSSILSTEQEKPLQISRLNGYQPQPVEIQLTIDLDLQTAAYTYLRNQGYNGSIVVMNYETGDLITMVSTPSVDVFDPENYEAGAFLNKATTSYAPGSTMKGVTAAAVLEKNSAAAKTFTYECYGVDDYARCYQTTEHGAEHLNDILPNSCNCGTGAIARTMLLPDELDRYVHEIGLVDETIITDFHSQTGNIDASEDLTWSAIGQSADLVTPVAMTAFYAAVANDGVLSAPHLFMDTEAETQRIMRSDNAQYIADALQTVPENAGVQCEAFGKTGSAELADAPAHSWFVVSLTDENAPPYTITVFLENGGGSIYGKLVLADFVNTFLLGGE